MHSSISAWRASTTPEPAHIRVVRNRQVSPPASGFELDTGGGELPCSVLAMGLERTEAAGAALPLPRLHLGQRNARRLAGRSHRTTGRVGSRRPGERSFSAQTGRHRRGDHPIGPLPPRPAGGGQRHRRGRAGHDRPLACWPRPSIAWDWRRQPNRFPPAKSCRTSSWPFRPRSTPRVCGSAGVVRRQPGTILSDGRQLCWANRTQQPAPAVALVRTLVPQSAVQVPASRQTDWLLRHLPVPEVMPLPGAEAVPPHARVRLHDTWQLR